MKAFRIFLLTLIVIGIALLLAQNFWVPKFVQWILQQEPHSHIVAPAQTASDTPGAVSKNPNGESIYSSKKDGFQFSIPKRWHFNSYDGTLYNYNELSAAGKSGFPSGDNKIEFGVSEVDITTVQTDPNPDYPVKHESHTRVMVAGQTATRTDVELLSGDKILSYRIPLKGSGKFLSFSMYGDPTNFPVLDTLVNTVMWNR